MKFVDKISVLIIQKKLIERYGGIHGLRDEGALESAIYAAKNRYNHKLRNLPRSPQLTLFICRRHTLFSMETNESRRRLPECFSK